MPDRPKGRASLLRRSGLPLAVAIVSLATVIHAPEVLAWPHHMVVGTATIYAEQPLNRDLATILSNAEARLKLSPLHESGTPSRIFLTSGGWRWRLLALRSSGAFAISRPLSETIVVNKSSIADDWVRNGMATGGQRRLSDVIAHERTHGMIRSHFGVLQATAFPDWKVEGYCDHVAGEGSLSAEDVTRMKARGERHPAIVYFEGRQRVEARLRQGATVEQLFAE